VLVELKSRPEGLFSVAPALISPHLWRYWHNRIHHRSFNVAGFDPDSFGLASERKGSTFDGFLRWFAPGGRCSTYVTLLVGFTVHGQRVLWSHSRAWSRSNSFSRQRAGLETLAQVVGWVGVGWWLGGVTAIFVIVLPMLVMNVVLLGYILTHHSLSPLTEDDNASVLETTMSVTTHPWLDAIHCNLSHHVEHHLFPTVDSRWYPLIRRALRNEAPDRYSCPRHGRALRAVLRSPRPYYGLDALVDQQKGTIYPLEAIRTHLLGKVTTRT